MKRINLTSTLLLIAFVAVSQPVQWRGPQRDGKFPGTGLLKKWPKVGPELVLKVEGIGKGFSSVVATNQNIFATGQIDTLDYLTCIDFQGNKKWQVPYGESWKQSYPETRSSPTVEGDRVYVLSGIGELSCINAETGTTNWKVNVDKGYKAEWHDWGVAESPLIVDNKVICTPAGSVTSVVALDKLTGKEVWKSPCIEGQRSYVSPTIFNYNGEKYILAATASNLLVVDPNTGDIKMSYKYFNPKIWKYQPKGMIWANTPLIKGNQIFLSIGYNYPAKMLKVNQDVSGFEEVYTDSVLDNHYHGLIELDGYIYGSNWLNNAKGNWVCKEWDSGKIMYETPWYTKGAMVYADGLLYIMEEKSGTIALVKPKPEKFEVISSFKLQGGNGPFWSHPFIANGNLYLRHGEVLYVYNIKA